MKLYYYTNNDNRDLSEDQIIKLSTETPDRAAYGYKYAFCFEAKPDYDLEVYEGAPSDEESIAEMMEEMGIDILVEDKFNVFICDPSLFNISLIQIK